MNNFRQEMDRMRRRRQRFAAVFMVAWVMIAVLIVGSLAWALVHPEAVGGFLGRIIAGARAAQ